MFCQTLIYQLPYLGLNAMMGLLTRGTDIPVWQLKDTFKGVIVVRNQLNTVSTLYELLERSAKQHAMFQEVQKRRLDTYKSEGRLRTLKHHCETKWSSWYLSIHTMKEQFEAMVETLEEQEQDTTIGSNTAAILKSMSTFDFIFGIAVLDKVLNVPQVMSRYNSGSSVVKKIFNQDV